jgi:hypothetical protein
MLEGTAMKIPLHARDGSVKDWALVDPEDFSVLSALRWSPINGSYGIRARRRGPIIDGKQTTIFMHRQIMGLERGDRREVDHINHDVLDNRRANLRVVTHAQNHQNRAGITHRAARTSRFRGVSLDARYKSLPWRVQVRAGDLNLVAYCRTEDEAGAKAAELRREHLPFSAEASA